MKNSLYILLGLMLVACGKDTGYKSEPVAIGRIDMFVSDGIGSADSLRPGLDLYIRVMGLDSLTMEEALARLEDSDVTRVFGMDIKSRFTASDSLSGPLGSALKGLGHLLPDIDRVDVYGVASPYMQSVIVGDSVVLVALNHYLGVDYPGYASMPAYMVRQKVPARIVPDVVEALVRVSYPYKPMDGTLIERMLYEGAVTKAVAAALGGDVGLAMGYTESQLDEAVSLEDDAWNALAVGRMLYSQSHADISSLFDPSPFTRIGLSEFPPRMGRYIGMRIVDSYMDCHQDVSLSSLLSSGFYGDAQSSLIESRYNPL